MSYCIVDKVDWLARNERRSLLHAHHAGAVLFDLLKAERDRVTCRLAFLDSLIDAGRIEYDRAKAHLDDCLALAGDTHTIYMSMDDSLRRTCRRAFFDRTNVHELDRGAIAGLNIKWVCCTVR